MKKQVFTAAIFAASFARGGCQETPVQPVAVLPASDPRAYQPQPMPKPLPPSEGYAGGASQPGAAPGGLVVSPNPSIANEDAFVAVYAKHSARMMIFVNRTLS